MIRVIAEFKPKSGIFVILPTVIFFSRGSDPEAGGYYDLTASWLVFGLTLRFG